MTQFDQQYKQAVWEIMNEGMEEFNERTGHKTKIIPGITFHLDNGFPLLTLRKIPLWRQFLDLRLLYWDCRQTHLSVIARSKATKQSHNFRLNTGIASLLLVARNDKMPFGDSPILILLDCLRVKM